MLKYKKPKIDRKKTSFYINPIIWNEFRMVCRAHHIKYDDALLMFIDYIKDNVPKDTNKLTFTEIKKIK